MKVMGQSLSSAARKVSRSVSSVFSSSPDEIDNKDVGRFAITPFIFKRTGYEDFDIFQKWWGGFTHLSAMVRERGTLSNWLIVGACLKIGRPALIIGILIIFLF